MQTIRTEKLILRPYTFEDIDVVHSFLCDFENAKYLLWKTESLDQTRRQIETAIEQAGKQPITKYFFAIELSKNNKMIGGCSIELDMQANEAEVGWVILKDNWGRGLGTLIARALIEFGFSELKLRRIYAVCDSENIASYRVMEKSGMRKEGHFVKSRLSRGEYKDELYYAILREEWVG